MQKFMKVYIKVNVRFYLTFTSSHMGDTDNFTYKILDFFKKCLFSVVE